ncbi:hypothetical protein BI084_gp78 [Gordonia phage Terapin]|uniref:Uncharacterized protein n=4 Tax=Terapinvirus terapin TaxID=2734283 RepID=A0A345MBB7_9CAUD|nr:hypothetical protein BI084_gp78 [Gordonia phage Terapin]AOE44890.1 hypothetical protein SEA_TERAPIN_78 [Gordonia phage Terapin]AVP43354.1 hypothetical protein PBI_DJOKOVIC_77 [Gordonia phage Djokovic]AXH67788.1 hypothetical protein SEA_BEYONCAGE_77 [Gordonia phage Beyoncage]QOC56647.1 hypothetical protein SEA_BITESIZE_77 [Gordonia phage BiteSize]
MTDPITEGIDPDTLKRYEALVEEIMSEFDENELEKANELVKRYERRVTDVDAFIVRENYAELISPLPPQYAAKEEQMRILSDWFLKLFQTLENDKGHTIGGGPLRVEDECPLWGFQLTMTQGLVPMGHKGIQELTSMLAEKGWDEDVAVRASVFASENFVLMEFLKSRLNALVGPTADFLSLGDVIGLLVAAVRANGGDMLQVNKEDNQGDKKRD